MAKSQNIKLIIAQNVRKHRKARGMTHDELSSLTGISYERIIDIETGQLEKVSIEDVETIADALDASVDDIMGV